MSRGRVLIVEDDDFTRMLLQRTVESIGYACTAVPTAVQAREAWDGDTFDIALLDLDLGPGPTGVDLARVMHEQEPDVRLFILTSYTDVRLVGNLPDLPPDVRIVTKSSLGDVDALLALLRDAEGAHSSGTDPALSDSQIELLRLLATGCSNAEIARKMWLSEPGIDKALARLAKVLNIESESSHNRRVLLVQEYYRRTGQGHAPRG